MAYDWKQFSSLLGMTEMEVAVCEIVNRLRERGVVLAPWDTSSIGPDNLYGSGTRLNYTDYMPPNDGGNSMIGRGFVCLIGNGWLVPSYPNGCFSPTARLVTKVSARMATLSRETKT